MMPGSDQFRKHLHSGVITVQYNAVLLIMFELPVYEDQGKSIRNTPCQVIDRLCGRRNNDTVGNAG